MNKTVNKIPKIYRSSETGFGFSNDLEQDSVSTPQHQEDTHDLHPSTSLTTQQPSPQNNQQTQQFPQHLLHQNAISLTTLEQQHSPQNGQQEQSYSTPSSFCDNTNEFDVNPVPPPSYYSSHHHHGYHMPSDSTSSTTLNVDDVLFLKSQDTHPFTSLTIQQPSPQSNQQIQQHPQHLLHQSAISLTTLEQQHNPQNGQQERSYSTSSSFCGNTNKFDVNSVPPPSYYSSHHHHGHNIPSDSTSSTTLNVNDALLLKSQQDTHTSTSLTTQQPSPQNNQQTQQYPQHLLHQNATSLTILEQQHSPQNGQQGQFYSTLSSFCDNTNKFDVNSVPPPSYYSSHHHHGHHMPSDSTSSTTLNVDNVLFLKSQDTRPFTSLTIQQPSPQSNQQTQQHPQHLLHQSATSLTTLEQQHSPQNGQQERSYSTSSSFCGNTNDFDVNPVPPPSYYSSHHHHGHHIPSDSTSSTTLNINDALLLKSQQNTHLFTSLTTQQNSPQQQSSCSNPGNPPSASVSTPVTINDLDNHSSSPSFYRGRTKKTPDIDYADLGYVTDSNNNCHYPLPSPYTPQSINSPTYEDSAYQSQDMFYQHDLEQDSVSTPQHQEDTHDLHPSTSLTTQQPSPQDNQQTQQHPQHLLHQSTTSLTILEQQHSPQRGQQERSYSTASSFCGNTNDFDVNLYPVSNNHSSLDHGGRIKGEAFQRSRRKAVRSSQPIRFHPFHHDHDHHMSSESTSSMTFITRLTA